MKHKAKMSIDYLAYQSKLNKYNAPFKIIIAVLTLMICVISKNPYTPLIVAVTMAAISIWGGVKPSEYLRLMFIPAGFIAAGTIALVIGISDMPTAHSIRLFSLYFYISHTGVNHALNAATRALGAVSALYMLTLSTPMGELVSALKKIHIPGIVISLMHMIYRFIFILADVCRSIKTAAESRLGYRNLKISCRSFALSAVSLLVISMKKADAYYNAMVSRGYDGELLFWAQDKPLKASHVIIGAVYIIGLIVVSIVLGSA